MLGAHVGVAVMAGDGVAQGTTPAGPDFGEAQMRKAKHVDASVFRSVERLLPLQDSLRLIVASRQNVTAQSCEGRRYARGVGRHEAAPVGAGMMHASAMAIIDGFVSHRQRIIVPRGAFEVRAANKLFHGAGFSVARNHHLNEGTVKGVVASTDSVK